MTATLEISDLHVAVEDTKILKGVDLTVGQGEIHALMGPNGTGKSTLAYALLGHPRYDVIQGQMLFNGRDLEDMEPDERARLGLFLAFQYPVAIPGVSLANFLRSAINARLRADNPEDKGVSIPKFRKMLKEKMDLLQMPHEFAGRYLNEGFSGGEKKRAEILQLATLEPEIAVLDETDSGLDIDALQTVAEGVTRVASPERGFLIITHYQRMLDYITPDVVHVFVDGRIARTGGATLAKQIEEDGYEAFRTEAV